MKFATLLFTMPAFLKLCGAEPDSKPVESQPAPMFVPDQRLEAVVRVDMSKRFRGSGIAVTPHHVVSSTMTLDGYSLKGNSITVDAPRHSATVAAADDVLGMVLLKTSADLPSVMPLGNDPRQHDLVMIGAFFEVGAQLNTLERIQFGGSVFADDARIETTGVQNALGSLDVRCGRNKVGLWRGGAAVMEPQTGRTIGLIFGPDYVDNNPSGPLYAIPASKIKAFLKANGVSYAE